MTRRFMFALTCGPLLLSAKNKPAAETPLDRMIRESTAESRVTPGASPGSLWSPAAPLGDLATDLRPRRVNDIVTVVVVDHASAVARGTVRSARSSQASGGINALAGTPPFGSRLPNLLNLGSESSLDGEGETSRETVLSTTLTARVTHVLPNGLLAVEGSKSVRVNSEMQTIVVRGLLRPFDVSPVNTVLSDQLAALEIAVNGRGVVADAVRRPNFLYRLLLGILPF